MQSRPGKWAASAGVSRDDMTRCPARGPTIEHLVGLKVAIAATSVPSLASCASFTYRLSYVSTTSVHLVATDWCSSKWQAAWLARHASASNSVSCLELREPPNLHCNGCVRRSCATIRKTPAASCRRRLHSLLDQYSMIILVAEWIHFTLFGRILPTKILKVYTFSG